jgi:type I restriction-modification system DNA methylase subunit
LNKELEQARKFLNEKFLQLLKSKGIEISKEELLKLKPFHWGFEFYEVFDLEKPKEERGFDIIIGNPPYGDILSKSENNIVKKTYYYKVMKSDIMGSGSRNSAGIFIERSYYLLKNYGKFGYIVPHRITRTQEFTKLRKMLLTETYLYEIVDSGNPFIGVTLEMIEIFFSKEKKKYYKIKTKSRRLGTLRPEIMNHGIDYREFIDFNMFVIYYDEIF